MLLDGVVLGKFFPVLWFCDTGTRVTLLLFSFQVDSKLLHLARGNVFSHQVLAPFKFGAGFSAAALLCFVLLQAESDGWGDEGELTWEDTSW